MNRINEWERVARFERATPHVYKVKSLWSSGSAWVWDHDTFITNEHVVDGMVGYESNVKIVKGDRIWQATKITILKDVDAAMVDVVGVSLHPLKRDSRTLRPGEYVLVGGYPHGVGPMLTEGYITGWYGPKYYTDVAVNGGSSGGPAFSKDGDIVGMTVEMTVRGGRSMALLIPLQRIINGMERPEFNATDEALDGER
jgi:serine protease Do